MSPRKLRSSSRARTTLATSAAVFGLLQLALAGAVEAWLPQLRDPIYGDKLLQLKRQIAAAPAEAPLVVMLGSSRTVHGLDAEKLERELSRRRRGLVIAYNFGLPGAGPFTELVCLRRLLAEGIRPDLALVEVLPPMLAGQTPCYDLGQYPADRIWRREIPLVERYTAEIFPERQLELEWWQSCLAPYHSHRFALMRVICPAFVPPEGRGHLFAQFDARGWNPMPEQTRTAERFESALKTAHREYAYLLAEFKLGGAACQALREILQICQSERIPAALVLMPEGHEFRSWYPPAALAEIDSFLAELSQQYSAPIVDGRQWVDDGGFLDSHHLLVPGAERFSELLAAQATPVLGERQTAAKGPVAAPRARLR